MMHVGCFKWRSRVGYRSDYGPPEPVNILRRMVARNYKTPHDFFCITDDPTGLDPQVRVIPLWDTFRSLPSPHGGNNPSCYVRLPAYGPAMREVIGPRFVLLDIDVLILADMCPVWDRPEDFVIWGDTARGTPYNGSMVLMNAGARARVLTEFDPVESPKRGRELKYIGSDQAWIGACLGPGEAKWTARDGVYSYRNEIQPRGGHLPPGARIVIFHGHVDPWHPSTRARHLWVREHYR